MKYLNRVCGIKLILSIGESLEKSIASYSVLVVTVSEANWRQLLDTYQFKASPRVRFNLKRRKKMSLIKRVRLNMLLLLCNPFISGHLSLNDRPPYKVR